jgi:hypothetical protein
MERGILLAPFPGVITNRFKDPGVVLQAGAPIFNLQSTTILKVKIGVPEKVASKLKVGSTQELFIANEKIPATLAALLPQINRQTQTRVMILNLHNETVLPGATVEWRHSQEHKADGYWLPTTALLPGRRGLWSYFLLEPENETSFRVRRQEVQIFHSEADRALVQVDSIVDGTLFISSGVNRVVPGQLVAAKFDGVVKL